MLPPEVQRIVLLIGLAATAYLLLLAWNEDYLQNGAATTADATQQEPAGSGGSGDFAEPAAPADGAGDFPDASFIANKAPASAPTPAAGGSSRDLITVTTPTLKVWIDPVGGDLVRIQLLRYRLTLDNLEVPYTLLDNSGGRTYVAQSALMGPDGIDTGENGRPLYRSERSAYDIGPGESLTVTLRSSRDGLEVVKRYGFEADQHLIDVRYEVRNGREEPIRASLVGQIKRDDREAPGSNSFTLGPQPYLGAALTTSDSRYERLPFDDVEEASYRTVEQGGWIAFLQHYFISAWIPDADASNTFYGRKRPDGIYTFGFTGPLTEVAPGATGSWQARFYAGPKNQKRLEEISPNLNLTVDYGILWWLAVPLFYLLDWLHGLVGNWGVAIILLTLLVKLVLYPLSSASYRSMANMRRVAPQMKRLQERHSDDRQKLSQEMMALYKKEKVNPLGGCLPMLLPMPIFIALYWVLYESVELRHAPFMLWINDLSAMDPWFVLPLLMGGSMYLQQLMSPAMGDPMQVRMMRLMPVMFTALFLFFPAGLVLYWLVNNVLSIAQQWWVMRQHDLAQASRA